jgi:glycine/serine hydroxymethyltransferase
MSAIFSDPFPHAAVVTASTTVPLAVPARGLLLSNFAASANSITVVTVGGETVVIALGTQTTASAPIYLPIQVTMVTATTGVGTIVALWH